MKIERPNYEKLVKATKKRLGTGKHIDSGNVTEGKPIIQKEVIKK